MKKILLIVSLIGCTTIGYAQDHNNTCKTKTVYHHHKTTVHKTKTAVQKPAPLVVTPVAIPGIDFNLATSNTPVNRCVIDSNGDINYVHNYMYLGYYSGNYANCDVYNEIDAPYKDMTVTSTAFTNYGSIPVKYTCQGEAASPPLSVTNIPPGTKSLAVIMFDPHASAAKSTVYWLMWNVDTTGVIPENFANNHESVNPVNKQYGYQGICPAGGVHYYHFRIYALDAKLTLGKQTNQATLEGAMFGHILAKGELVGTYNMQAH